MPNTSRARPTMQYKALVSSISSTDSGCLLFFGFETPNLQISVLLTFEFQNPHPLLHDGIRDIKKSV